MFINAKGLALEKEFEGERLTPYQDGKGVWTIGVGHTHGVTANTHPLTHEEAMAYLASDNTIAETAVARGLRREANSNQFSAMVSLCFNIGSSAFLSSTLLRLFNNGEVAAAGDQFLRWKFIDGKPSPGLLRRRIAEKSLYDTFDKPIK